MAEFQQKDMRGALFVNHRKQRDTQPDRTGTVMVAGTEYYISGWLEKIKQGEHAGETYLSIALSEKQARTRGAQPAPQPADFNDDIPF